MVDINHRPKISLEEKVGKEGNLRISLTLRPVDFAHTDKLANLAEESNKEEESQIGR